MVGKGKDRQQKTPESNKAPRAMSQLFAWWFLNGGAKEAAWRTIACVTLASTIIPRVTPLIQALLAFLVVSLLLGPLFAALRSATIHLRTAAELRRERLEPSTANLPRSFLRPAATLIVLAAVVAGISVYVVSKEASNRRIAEERREFAAEKARLREEQHTAIRQERHRRRAALARLAHARLRESRARIAALVSRARREYWAWENLLLERFEASRVTRGIMSEVSQDIRNISWAHHRLASPGDARRLRNEISEWIARNKQNRRLIERGATFYYPARFVRQA